MKSLVSFPGNYPAWSTYASNKLAGRRLNREQYGYKQLDFSK